MVRNTLVFSIALTACAAGSSNRPGFDDGSGNASDAGAQSPSTESSVFGTDSRNDGGTFISAPSTTTLLYAHTDTTLFQLDPKALDAPMKEIGNFDCVGKSGKATSMTDLAVTKDGKLFGVSEGFAFPLTVTGNTVHCEASWSLPQTRFYGLTVAPENTLGSDEVLIGADGEGGLYQIDPTSGMPTQVGTLGVDRKTKLPWSLSGDIVFLANGGKPIGFATVRTCSAKGPCAPVDTLIEVDIKAIKPGKQSVLKSVRGPVVLGDWCKNPASPKTFGSMFGIVAYEDVVFGFSRTGDVVEIHNSDGTGCLISSDKNRLFAGAGITTSAPVLPPAVR